MAIDRDRIGSRVQEVRGASGLSLRDLEAATGINRGTISHIEQGWRLATDEQIRLLAKALPGVAVWLLGLADGS